MRTPLLAGLAGLAVVLVAGCGGSGSSPGSPAEPQPSWTSCSEAGAPAPAPDANPAETLQLPRLGADFAPTAVVVCRLEPDKRADGGTDLVAAESRANGPDDVAAVLDALRLPDERRTAQACTADLPGVPWFALVDADGRWVRPGTPADACGKIRIEVRQAVENLTLLRVSAHPVRELESSGAAATGCTQDWADIVWVTGQHRSDPSPPTGEDPFASAAALRVCVYRVPPGEQGGGKPTGTFVRGSELPAERRPILAAALKQTTAAPPCTTPASLFALVRPADDTAGTLYVELDGCQRVLVEVGNDPGRLGRAHATLVGLFS